MLKRKVTPISGGCTKYFLAVLSFKNYFVVSVCWRVSLLMCLRVSVLVCQCAKYFLAVLLFKIFFLLRYLI